ncbi:MAG: signal peptidase I [Chloroflexi bacterium]|nr:signal peptidase I [Chloroflexota bacterium]
MTGNAARDGDPYRGWFVGSFMPPDAGLASTTHVEVKWGTHALGDVRADWGASDVATTLSVLVRGCIRLVFGDGREALLAEPGDYALWAPGVRHRWSIERPETVVFTVRWRSNP